MMIKSKLIKIILVGLATTALITGCSKDNSNSGSASKDGIKTIGITQLVEHPSLDAANKGFVDALAAKGYKDGQNIKIDQQNAQADQSNLNSIAQRFVSDKKDLVLAIATPAAQTMANASVSYTH